MNRKVLVIAGPTASGKSSLAVCLAKRIGGEIVSADSMQVYRGMDVGTAKITSEEMDGVPHHMLSCAEPYENYSVSRYVMDASFCCDDILSRGRIPIIAGGTGLYIDSLISGRSFSPAVASDPLLTAALEARYDEIGGEAMLAELSSFDPERAAKLSPGDRRRILRAFEIYRLTGKSITEHDAETRLLPDRYDACRIVLQFSNRAILYDRINTRVDAMVKNGLFEEVSGLLASGLPNNCTALQAIGYKEVVSALRGELSRLEAIDSIKLSSRRYAKRQLTWFGRWTDVLRINVDDFDSSESIFASVVRSLTF